MTKTPITKQGFDLEERTLEFSKSTIHLCKRIIINVFNRDIISQLIRSCSSIGANYREANDALSKKDFVHRIKITRREAKETYYWLQLLEEVNPSLREEIKNYLNEALELKKIFSSIADKSS